MMVYQSLTWMDRTCKFRKLNVKSAVLNASQELRTRLNAQDAATCQAPKLEIKTKKIEQKGALLIMTESQQIDKKVAEKPKIDRCGRCYNWKSVCILGYNVKAKSKPCSQGIERQREKP